MIMSNELVEDTIGEPTASEDEENGDLTDFDLYTEKATSLIYEAKVFDDFVIVRPASPYFYDAIARMSVETFAEDFEEFAGDHSKVKRYVKNITDSLDEMI